MESKIVEVFVTLRFFVPIHLFFPQCVIASKHCINIDSHRNMSIHNWILRFYNFQQECNDLLGFGLQKSYSLSIKVALTGSKTIGAFGPINIAIEPAPPVALALPLGYTAISELITTPKRPSQEEDSIQFSVLKIAFVDP